MDGSDKLEGIVYRVNEYEIVVSFKEMHDFVRIRYILTFNLGRPKIANIIGSLSE
jgi:hypothetical protein